MLITDEFYAVRTSKDALCKLWELSKLMGCKVQLHVPVVHPGQRPKVGDGQSGRSTVGKLFSRAATVTVKAWLEP